MAKRLRPANGVEERVNEDEKAGGTGVKSTSEYNDIMFCSSFFWVTNFFSLSSCSSQWRKPNLNQERGSLPSLKMSTVNDYKKKGFKK